MISHVPGEPALAADLRIVGEFLERELATPLLDQLSKKNYGSLLVRLDDILMQFIAIELWVGKLYRDYRSAHR